MCWAMIQRAYVCARIGVFTQGGLGRTMSTHSPAGTRRPVSVPSPLSLPPDLRDKATTPETRPSSPCFDRKPHGTGSPPSQGRPLPLRPVKHFAAVAPPSSEPGSAIAVAIFDSLARISCSSLLGKDETSERSGWAWSRCQQGRQDTRQDKARQGMGEQDKTRQGMAVALYHAHHHQHQHQHHTDEDDDEHCQGPPPPAPPAPPAPARASGPAQPAGRPGPEARRQVGCGAVASSGLAGWGSFLLGGGKNPYGKWGHLFVARETVSYQGGRLACLVGGRGRGERERGRERESESVTGASLRGGTK